LIVASGESVYSLLSTALLTNFAAARMTDYREINALQRAPKRAQGLARFLLKLHDIEWTEWELDFLESMSRREADEDLSTRQAEKLVELHEASVWYNTAEGFSVRSLVRASSEMRHLLAEHDADWVKHHADIGTTSLRRRDVGRLMRCARTTGEIEPYQGWSVDTPRIEDAA
jgi:hypothetical protein